jgi:hypothetical protein
MTTPWSVEPEWEGETAVVIASGPSLTREQANFVKGKCRVIAVNNAGIDTVNSETQELVPAMAPWADVLFAADAKWWRCYHERALKFPGRKVTVKATLPWAEIYSLTQSTEHASFDPQPTHLVSGGNSGYMAVHLAVHFGAKRILLLGFDMRDGRNRKRHWFGNHPPKLNSRGNYAGWIRAFDKLAKVLNAKDVEVINCTPDTALRCFRRMSIEAALHGA